MYCESGSRLFGKAYGRLIILAIRQEYRYTVRMYRQL